MSFDKEFWGHYYSSTQEPEREWYETYVHLKPLFEKCIPKVVESILHVGCGCSLLGTQLFQDKFAKHVVNVDYCDTVINYMKDKQRNTDTVIYEVGDVTLLKYSDKSFDVVVDKGLMDSLLSTDSANDVMKMFEEIKRVKRGEGLYIIITAREDREFYFHRFGWTIVEKIVLERKQSYHNSFAAEEKFYWFVLK